MLLLRVNVKRWASASSSLSSSWWSTSPTQKELGGIVVLGRGSGINLIVSSTLYTHCALYWRTQRLARLVDSNSTQLYANIMVLFSSEDIRVHSLLHTAQLFTTHFCGRRRRRKPWRQPSVWSTFRCARHNVAHLCIVFNKYIWGGHRSRESLSHRTKRHSTWLLWRRCVSLFVVILYKANFCIIRCNVYDLIATRRVSCRKQNKQYVRRTYSDHTHCRRRYPPQYECGKVQAFELLQWQWYI